MTTQAPYRNRLAEAFGLPSAPTLITRTLHKSTMAVTELRCDQPGFGTTAPIPQENAYLIALQFRPCLDHDLYFEGRFVRPRNWFPGVVTMYDLRRSPVARSRIVARSGNKPVYQNTKDTEKYVEIANTSQINGELKLTQTEPY